MAQPDPTPPPSAASPIAIPDLNLRIPGPVPVPQRVLEAMARPMINHRGPTFRRIFHEITENLRRAFETHHDVLVLSASGTAGLEAAIVNTLSPGDRVLAVVIGVFGKRFATIARRFGADVVTYAVQPGEAADPAELARRLHEAGPFKAVLITHNETSTGVTNPLPELSATVQAAVGAGGTHPIVLVDAISSLAAIELKTDAWGCDIVVAGSQKAFFIPPGLAMVSVSERAWAANREAQMPRFYFDFALARQAAAEGSTPSTPAVSLFYGLHEALRMILDEEGLGGFQARHARVARRVRDGVRRLGLELFAPDAIASNTVTTVRVPAGIEARTLLRELRDERGVEFATGQGRLADTIFRIGHLGAVTEADIDGALAALGAALRDRGVVRAATSGP